MMLWQLILVTIFAAAATLGFMAGLGWLVAYLVKSPPGHESLFELLSKAGIKCPYCGRHPTVAHRNGLYNQERVSLSCDLMHVWFVNDSEFLVKKEDQSVDIH